MSHISFNSSDGDGAEVRGTEVAYLDFLFVDLAVAALGYLSSDEDYPALRQFIPRGGATEWVFEPDANGDHLWSTKLRSYLYTRRPFTVDGHQLHMWPLVLNTVASMSNDSMRALAFIFGTSTTYGWIQGQHGPWLADLLEAAQKSNILRANSGWEDAIELLRDNKTGPIVLNHSTNYDFPNVDLIPGADQVIGIFDQLSREDRWSIATSHLVPTQELSPKNIATLRYSTACHIKTGIHTMLDLRARFLDKP